MERCALSTHPSNRHIPKAKDTLCVAFRHDRQKRSGFFRSRHVYHDITAYEARQQGRGLLLNKRVDVAQVAALLVIVETITKDEIVRNLHRHILDVERHLQTLRL